MVHSNWLILVYWVLGFLDDYVPSRQSLKQLSAGSLASGSSFVLVREFQRERMFQKVFLTKKDRLMPPKVFPDILILASLNTVWWRRFECLSSFLFVNNNLEERIISFSASKELE